MVGKVLDLDTRSNFGIMPLNLRIVLGQIPPTACTFLQGEITETVMPGKTLDISQFCEFVLNSWVIFRDKPIQYPYNNSILERYLGHKIDVIMEMTDNLMKYNAEVVHYSTCSALTDAGIYNLARICMREKFDKNNAEIYGTDATTDNFTKINLEDTPYFELYEENNGDGLTVVSYDEETN